MKGSGYARTSTALYKRQVGFASEDWVRGMNIGFVVVPHRNASLSQAVGMANSAAAFQSRLSPSSSPLCMPRPLRIKTKGLETSPLASPTGRSPTLLKSPMAFGGINSSSCSSPRPSFGTNTTASPRPGQSGGGNGAAHFQTSTAEGTYLCLKPLEEVDRPVTLYDVLGIPEIVTDDEIKAAFRVMAKKFHPDHAPPEKAGEFQKKFMEVHKAYSVLKDPTTRAMYNYEIRNTVLTSPRRGREVKAACYGRNWETDQCW
ncbi:hypothetical protein R1sor_015637 [Riccia sorocarpa]|uniref:J domain-containing protein n=1 Tax=Riccia sorocarpa TaxID=122646 RepID=A0ABD3HCT5_9MARC